MTIEERVKIAQELAAANNGVLPITKWMRENGYNNLIHMMNKSPESFHHISK